MKVRKKPVVVEAVQWDGSNLDEIRNFVGDCLIEDYIEAYEPNQQKKKNILFQLEIETLEGNYICDFGDYIIKCVNGEFYPCKPDIFEKTYDVVKEERYLHDLSKEELVAYVERLQEQNKKLDKGLDNACELLSAAIKIEDCRDAKTLWKEKSLENA